jgi:mannose-6-phosphate isomerase-like protein (cupin superfamily)
MKTAREQADPYRTRDGSEIRELMHPEVHGNRNQSLAEATVHPGCRTRRHRHLRSEELYHVLSGSGCMTLAGKVFSVAAGDTVCIAPGMEHWIENTGNHDLVLLCCCAPPYSHADTELL